MKLICKNEALKAGGEKLMQFTKGKIYDFTEIKNETGTWYVIDDNGNNEVFWKLDIMFKEFK